MYGMHALPSDEAPTARCHGHGVLTDAESRVEMQSFLTIVRRTF